MSRRAVLAVMAGAALVGWLVAPAGASPAPEPEAPSAPALSAPARVTVEMGREAWYQLASISTCSSPAGCLPVVPPAIQGLPELPVDPTVYPPDTLHVGWAGGAETARTYVQIDRTSLPQGAVLTSGTLVVPLVADATSGTVMPEAAGVKACLATAEFADGTAGALSPAPEMDCSVSSPFTQEGSAFTVDLMPFVEAWAGGMPDHGIALTPFTSSSATSAWGLALPSRNATGLAHIAAHLEYAVPAVAPPVAAPAAPVALPAQPVPAPAVQAPAAAGRAAVTQPQPPAAPEQAVRAPGTSPFGWLVLGLGLLGLVALAHVVRMDDG